MQKYDIKRQFSYLYLPILLCSLFLMTPLYAAQQDAIANQNTTNNALKLNEQGQLDIYVPYLINRLDDKGDTYSALMRYLPEIEDNITFELLDVMGSIDSQSSDKISTLYLFDNNMQFHIPKLNYEGTDYWANFNVFLDEPSQNIHLAVQDYGLGSQAAMAHSVTQDAIANSTTNGIPQMVSLISASSSNADQLSLDWLPAKDNATTAKDMHYLIHLSQQANFTPDINQKTTVVQESTGGVSAIINGLQADTLYYAMVTATDQDGNSSWSNRLSVKTSPTVAKRTSNSVQTQTQTIAISDTQITLANTAATPQQGEIIVSEEGSGYLRKVISTQQQNGQIIVNTEPAKLADMFEDVEFSTTIRMENPNNSAETKQRRSINNRTQITWQQTGLTLSAGNDAQLVPASNIHFRDANNNRRALESDSQSDNDSYVRLTAPAYVKAEPDRNIIFKVTADILSNSDHIVCSIKMTDFEHDDSNLGKQPRPEIGGMISYKSGKQGVSSVSWRTTKNHVHSGGLPYHATFEVITDQGSESIPCEDSVLNSTNGFDITVPIYITMGNLPANEEAKVTLTGGFKVENTMTIDFKPEVEVGVKIKRSTLKEAKLITHVNMGLRHQLHIEATGAATLNVKPIELLKPRKFIKVFIIGGLPVVVNGEFGISLLVEGEAKGAMTLDIDQYLGIPNAEFGLHYVEGNGWQTVSNFQTRYEFKLNGEGDASVDLKLTVIPDLTLSFYDTASGRILVEPYLYANAGLHGQLRYENTSDGLLTDADYWFTDLETGGGIDMRLYAGADILGYNILSYPKDVKLNETSKFAFFSPIAKTPFAKLPELSVETDDFAVPYLDSRGILIVGTSEDVPNPFPVGPDSFFPFKAWTAPKIITNATGAFFQESQAVGSHWFQYENTGDYEIRLAGHSDLGSYIRQVTSLNISLTDDDNDGMIDQWESLYNVDDPNDTGITWGGDYPDGNNDTCTGETISVQDCSHGRDAIHSNDSDGSAGFSFTKISGGRCVQDNVTGLMWEVKTTDGGLHDAGDTYNWYNTNTATNGGADGVANDDSNICAGYQSGSPATYCNTQAYVARVNAQGWCGFKDWRMPNREALRSIVDYGRYDPSIDTDYFPNTQSSAYWTGSPLAADSDDAWDVYFSHGDDSSDIRGNQRYVRLVRGGQ